jgi:hypothetical protein
LHCQLNHWTTNDSGNCETAPNLQTPRNPISFESPHILDVFAAARLIYSRDAGFFPISGAARFKAKPAAVKVLEYGKIALGFQSDGSGRTTRARRNHVLN